MSNNDFRIAGALGLEPDLDPTDSAIQEVMTQGIGFPLRPISSTPPTSTPTIPEGTIAKGFPVQWMGDYAAGLYYPAGAFVRSGIVTAIARALTLTDPEPIPDPADPASRSIPDPWVNVVTQNNISQVASGQTYTFNKSGWIKELYVFVPVVTPDTSYRVIIVDLTDPDAPKTTVINEPTLTAGVWNIVSLLNAIVGAGSVVSITLESLNSSASTNISGGWRYGGPSQSTPPAAQGWNQDNQRTLFRIDKTDLDNTSRATELEGVIPDTTISVVQTDDVGNSVQYLVTSVTDNGTYMTYGVTLQGETGVIATSAVCTVDIDVPVPLATEYSEEAGHFAALPSWASEVTGSLAFDSVNQGVPATNAYGVDILFEPAQVSPDWDIVSIQT